ncbi:hypothetical protein [Actinomadura sp. 6N118]|uniref:hypothetical protein n=1 Tax=Actinomadura sp. 6N118 TaxID=3375151 RepID=UPI003795BB4B
MCGDDLLRQLHAAEGGPLDNPRAATAPDACWSGFDGSMHVSADADLIADGILIEFKITRRVHDLPLPVILQLLGYVLMDFVDRYKIDTLGVYLSRAGALITWPLEDYLALLGARRRNLTELRAVFAKLLAYLGCRAADDPLPDQLDGVRQLLAGLAPVIPAGCCRVCAQPPASPILGAGVPVCTAQHSAASVRRPCAATAGYNGVELRMRRPVTIRADRRHRGGAGRPRPAARPATTRQAAATPRLIS